MRAIGEACFEIPSLVQKEAIPYAILGEDLVCQAKSGMGKTAVFVLSVLHRIDFESDDNPQCLILTHVRELAFQIQKEFLRLGKYFLNLRCNTFFGGVSVEKHRTQLKVAPPHIAVGTPGRVLDLVRTGHLDLSKLRFFILDECDKMLDQVDMRQDVQNIFYKTKTKKQVMMYTATLTEKTEKVCLKFMQKNAHIIKVTSQKDLTLTGLTQYYCNVTEKEKTKTLLSLLGKLTYNQTVIFCKTIQRAKHLNEIINHLDLESITIHTKMSQEERIERYEQFKTCKKRIMVCTDIFARGIDIEKVNVVFNYDMPADSDTYLHRIGRAGRFDSRGLAISFVSNDDDKEVLKEIQGRFVIEMNELPEKIDHSLYTNN